MLTKKVSHESPFTGDRKKLAVIVKWIRLEEQRGLKKGQLILKAQVPFNQWQFYHAVLVDLPEIEWDKRNHTYTSYLPHKEPVVFD